MRDFGCSRAEKRMIMSLFMEPGQTFSQLYGNVGVTPNQMDRGLTNLALQRIITVAWDDSGTARFSLATGGEA